MSRSYGLAVAATAALLGGCAGDFNPVRDVAVATGIGAERRQAADFVVQSRPDQLDYIPVGVSAPPREQAAKPQPAVRAAQGELDAIRAQNEARAAEARQVGAAVPAVEAPRPAR
jgi:hypothetical protein